MWELSSRTCSHVLQFTTFTELIPCLTGDLKKSTFRSSRISLNSCSALCLGIIAISRSELYGDQYLHYSVCSILQYLHWD